VRALLHLAEKALITKYIVQCAIKALCCSAGRKTRAKKVRALSLRGQRRERARGDKYKKKKHEFPRKVAAHSGVNTTPLLKRRSPAQLCACLFNPKSISNQYSRRDAFARRGCCCQQPPLAIYVYACCVRKRLYRAQCKLCSDLWTREGSRVRITTRRHGPYFN
jgi:hypothetical protein